MTISPVVAGIDTVLRSDTPSAADVAAALGTLKGTLDGNATKFNTDLAAVRADVAALITKVALIRTNERTAGQMT